MRRLPFFMLFLFATAETNAQRTVDVNKAEIKPGGSTTFFFVVNGEPFVNTKFTRVVEGTPYFNDEWMKGAVVMNGGTEFNDQFLKLDLIENEVHYRDSAGKEMIITSLVQQVKLIDTVSQVIHRFVHSSFINAEKVEKGWYELLSEGKQASMFKQYRKTIQEVQPYGSATVEQYINTVPKYSLFYNNSLYPILRLKDLPSVLSNKKQELLKYISDRDLKGKADKDFIELVNYYNSLQP